MRKLRAFGVALVIVGGLAVPMVRIDAQAPTANAALRYWTAFAVMQDGPADKPTADLLEAVLAGKAAWDETRLGAFVDGNDEALEIFARAAALGTCDWGVEYELGAFAPVPHVAKARALARLNALAGIRRAARKELPAAVDTWLNGIRFSQHVARGGTLVSALAAGGAFGVNADALERAAAAAPPGAAERQKIAALLRTLPETIVDWGAALDREAQVLDVSLNDMRERGYDFISAEQRRRLPNNGRPTPEDIAAVRRVFASASEAFRLPPELTAARLADIATASQALPRPLPQIVPNFTVTNPVRTRLKAQRERLLLAVSR